MVGTHIPHVAAAAHLPHTSTVHTNLQSASAARLRDLYQRVSLGGHPFQHQPVYANFDGSPHLHTPHPGVAVPSASAAAYQEYLLLTARAAAHNTQPLSLPLSLATFAGGFAFDAGCCCCL